MVFNNGYALIVGVGCYHSAPHLDVPATAADARAIADVLGHPDYCGYPAEQIQLLTGAEATRPQVLAALAELASRASEEATIFLFYSGHGYHDAQGNYYLTTSDTTFDESKLIGSTAISQQELIEQLRALRARRALLIFNACHAGEISPILGPTKAQPSGTSLPQTTASALLATGEGRIIITSCREDQYAYIGSGEQTIFAQALVNSLSGVGCNSRAGYISAFDLYTALYQMVDRSVREQIPEELRHRYCERQEPELTVLKGIGPFAVALYRGSVALGEFSAPPQIGKGLAVHEISDAERQIAYQHIVAGPFASTRITAHQRGGVSLGFGNTVGRIGDVVGGDRIAQGGEKAGRDIVSYGDTISLDHIQHSITAVGRGAQISITAGVEKSSADRLFEQLNAQIQARPDDPNVGKDEISDKVMRIRSEAGKRQPNIKSIGRWLSELAQLAPDICDQTVACLLNPRAGFDSCVTTIAQALELQKR